MEEPPMSASPSYSTFGPVWELFQWFDEEPCCWRQTALRKQICNILTCHCFNGEECTLINSRGHFYCLFVCCIEMRPWLLNASSSDGFKKGENFGSASFQTLWNSALAVLINLKGPFPLLQEQQLIKWLISDGRV